jgi:hypothetical protein
VKKKWYTWHDLLDHWGITGSELLEEFKKGLQPYHGINDDEIMCCPNKFHAWGFLENELKEMEDFELNLHGDPNYEHYPEITLEELKVEKKKVIEQIQKIKNAEDKNRLSWKNLGPLTAELREGLLSEMERAIFKADNVLEHEKKFGLELKTVMKPQPYNYKPIDVQRKKRPNQIAKTKCRDIVKELWKKHYIRSKEMAGRPELLEVAGEYALETRRRWICDLTPPELRKAGRPKKKQPKSSK